MTNRKYLDYCIVLGKFTKDIDEYFRRVNNKLIDSDIDLKLYFETFNDIEGDLFERIDNLNLIYRACLGDSRDINRFLENLRTHRNVYNGYIKGDKQKLLESYENGLRTILDFFARNTFKGYVDIVEKMSLGIKLRFYVNTINYGEACEAYHNKHVNSFDIIDRNGNVLERNVAMIIYKNGEIIPYKLDELKDTDDIYSVLKSNIRECDCVVWFISMLERKFYRFIEYLYGNSDSF